MKKGIENVKRVFAFGAEFMDVLTKGLKGKDWAALSELVDEALDLTKTDWELLKLELLDLDSDERKELSEIVESRIENSNEILEDMVESIAFWVITTVDVAMSLVEYRKDQKLKGDK